MSTGVDKAVETVKKAQTIAIFGHIHPDGDSIGSLVSLGLGLKRLGKRVDMLSSDGVPRRYRRLPGANKVVRRIDHEVDLAIAVDCSNREILGAGFDVFSNAKKILEIDHHEFRRPFGHVRFVDHKAVAVGELIYQLLAALKVRINRSIAQNILTSIIVETNSFRLPNVRPFSFEVCNQLLKTGVDFYNLVDTVFWSKTKESAVLSGICLSRCKFLKRNRLVWAIVRKKDFDLVKGKDEDVDAVADEMRSIKGVKVVILFRENQEKMLRVSLRSKGKINVALLAAEYGGGGHFDVAGCSIPKSPSAIKKFVIAAGKLLY